VRGGAVASQNLEGGGRPRCHRTGEDEHGIALQSPGVTVVHVKNVVVNLDDKVPHIPRHHYYGKLGILLVLHGSEPCSFLLQALPAAYVYESQLRQQHRSSSLDQDRFQRFPRCSQTITDSQCTE